MSLLEKHIYIDVPIIPRNSMHERLGLEPLLDIRFRLGEGTGAALCMELFDAATRILADIKTFEKVAIIDVQEKGASS